MARRLLCAVASVLMVVMAFPGAAGASEVVPFGGAPAVGAAPSGSGANRVVSLVATPSGEGYWQPSASGAVFPFGDARSFGPASVINGLNRPIVGMAATPSGAGYWLVASDGGIFTFGDARFAGSTGAMRLNRPIVGMAATPSGAGYWLVASDGGIFTFGDARFAGSTGAMRLNRPIVGMAATPSGAGYWLVASDGGIFTFGDAPFAGSAGSERLADPVVAMAATPSGRGYRLATFDGRVLAYGDATDDGSLAAACKAEPVVALAGRTSGGYWLGTSSFLPAWIPPGTDPIDTLTIESSDMQTILRLRQACRPDPAPSPGRFTSPLPGARVTSSFGMRIHPIYHRPALHSGIDLAGGSRILAAGNGTVVQVLSRQGFGLTTIVDHGDGTATVYAHQAAVSVKTGDVVRAGQAIGTVGSSGYATGPHLHFEVRVHGVPTDPTRWL